MIRDRIEQHQRTHSILIGRPKEALRCHGCEIRPGTVSSQSKSPTVPAEGRSIARSPTECRQDIFNAGRKQMLRGQPIINRQNDDTSGFAEKPTKRIVRFDGADHPAAAVRIDQHGQWRPLVERKVKPRPQAASDCDIARADAV